MDPPPAIPDANGAKTDASVLSLLLAVFLLTINFRVPTNESPYVWVAQLCLLILLFNFWSHVSSRLSRPSSATIAARRKRLDAAIPHAGVSGLTEAWYDDAQVALSRVGKAVTTAAMVLLLVGVVEAYPSSLLSWLGASLQHVWDRVHASGSEKHVFVVGVFGAHMVAFWGLGLLYALLDLTRPAWALPYKIQEGMKVSRSDFLKAVAMALMNQAVLLLVVLLVWEVFPVFCPDGFSAQLPALTTMLMHMIVSLVVAELIFYGTHRLLHTPWMFAHVHYIHHTWQAPIGITAIFAHPLEFLLGNVPVVMFGPLLCGAHASVWILYTFLSTIDTVHGHSGWHLPFLGSSEAHDFHHWEGNDNYGVLSVLDTYYGTNAVYNASYRRTLDANYTAPDYPVDKILNRMAAGEAEERGESAQSTPAGQLAV